MGGVGEAGEAYEADDGPEVNRCIDCRIDMGACNPRQLCGKVRCLNPPRTTRSTAEI